MGIREQLHVDTSDATRSLRNLGDAAGDLDSRLSPIAGLLGEISPAAGSAVAITQDLLATFEAIAISGAGVTAALGAVTAAIGGAALLGGIVATTAAADDLYESLEDLRGVGAIEPLHPETLQGLEYANASLEAIGVLAKEAVVILGAEFAPAVEAVARGLVTVGVVGVDALRALAESTDLLLAGLGSAINLLISGFTAPLERVVDLAAIADDAARAMGVDTGGLGSAIQDASDALNDLGGISLEFAGSALSSALGALDGYLSGSVEKADALIARIVALNTAATPEEVAAFVKELDKQRDALFNVIDAEQELLLLQAEAELGPGLFDLSTLGAETFADLADQARALGIEVESLGDPLADTYLLLTQIEDAAAKGLLNPDQAEALQGAVEAQLDALQQGAAISIEQGARAGLQALQGDASGLLTLGATALGGPLAGAITSALLPALQGLGEGADPSQDIADQLDAIREGILALPEELPQIAAALVEGGVKLLPVLIQAQIEGAIYLIANLPSAIGDAIGTALRDLFMDLADSIRDAIADLKDFSLEDDGRKLAVNASRWIAGFATLGLSEAALGAANAASGGQVNDALYNGRDGQTSSTNARASRYYNQGAGDRSGVDLGQALTQFDRRQNLTSGGGVLYSAARQPRVT
jgi:hypothetical protein